MNEHELLDEHETATELKASVGTLRNWRCSRLGGPPYIKVGRLVRYRRSDLVKWLDHQTVTVTEGVVS
jgi:hypothetical protein